MRVKITNRSPNPSCDQEWVEYGEYIEQCVLPETGSYIQRQGAIIKLDSGAIVARPLDSLEFVKSKDTEAEENKCGWYIQFLEGVIEGLGVSQELRDRIEKTKYNIFYQGPSDE